MRPAPHSDEIPIPAFSLDSDGDESDVLQPEDYETHGECYKFLFD